MPFLKDDKNFKSRGVQDNPSFVGSIAPIRNFKGFTALITAAVGVSGISKVLSGNSLGGRAAGALAVGLSIGEAINQTGYNPFMLLGKAVGLIDKDMPSETSLLDQFNTSGGNKPLFFQFFPETITDDRQVDFNEQTLPFLTNPIPTFVSASPRTVAFSLQFAQELWIPSGSGDKNQMQWTKHNFNVGLAVQAIRSLAYPLSGIVPQPLLLTLPGTQIGIDGDSIYCLLKGYSTSYDAFFPDGQPRIASMSLTLQEFTTLTGPRGNITGASFNKVYADYVRYVESAIQNTGGFQSSKDISTPGKTKQLNSAPPAVPAATAL